MTDPIRANAVVILRNCTFLLAWAVVNAGPWALADGLTADIPHGAIHEETYFSHSLESNRRLSIYTPPGYEAAAGRLFPTLYLLHGWGSDEKSWIVDGGVNLKLDDLIAQAKVKPMIVVMPQGHAQFPSLPVSPGGRPPTSSEALEADLFNDTIPFVEKNYRIDRSADARAIAGLSMGGRQALFIGLNHPEMFRWVAGFSAAIRDRVFDDDYQDITVDPQHETKDTRLIWFGCGRADGCFPANGQFHDWLAAKNIPHVWRPSEGGHDWPVWRDYLTQVLPLLFQ